MNPQAKSISHAGDYVYTETSARSQPHVSAQNRAMTIDDELSDLQKIVEMLSIEITNLEERASPFLRPAQMTAEQSAEIKQRSARSVVAEQLSDLDSRLRGIGGRIRDVAARIDRP